MCVCVCVWVCERDGEGSGVYMQCDGSEGTDARGGREIYVPT